MNNASYNNANLFKVFVLGWLFTGGFAFLLFALFSTVEANIDFRSSLVFGALCGIPFGLMYMLMIYIERKSQKFWDYAKEVEVKIEKAETKSAIESIYKWEFETLRELAQGLPHVHEVNRLYTIMQTKYKYTK